MSRVFAGYASEGSVASVNSQAQVSAFSFAAWVNVTDPQASGGTVFVKDPVGSYLTFMEILADGTLYCGCGDKYLGTANQATIGVPGSGYVSNDTGFFVGNNPDIPDNQAEYRIGGAPGGVPTNPVGILAGGTGFAVGHTYTTVRGGGQPGSGSGLTLTVTQIINQANAFAQSVETVPVGTWTHVAMTWDSAGDGLVHLYINGVECTYQNERTTTINPDTSTGPYYIGDDSFDYTLAGDIAEAVVFGNTALTGAQIAALAASTHGVPAALLGSATEYWHLCGLSNPEPNVVNPTNTGTVVNATQGANSPGYTACGSNRVATKETISIGEFGGSSLATAFYNPSHYDLIQVLNEGGEVVWNLDYQGNANVNPASPTKKAIVGSYYGASFAIAFPNPLQQDVFQVVGPGDIVHFWVDYQGNAHSA